MNKASFEPLSIRLAVMLAALVAIGPFAIDTYLPALPVMAKGFDASAASLQLTVSFYFIGAAVGQIIGGPVSDSKGRKPVALLGLSIFLLTSLLISMAETVNQLLILRFIQALGGGATVVISAAAVRDRYGNKREAAKMLSLVSMLMLMAPLVAPGFGALVLAFSGWRTIFVALAFYSGLLLLMVTFYFPETLGANSSSSTSARSVFQAYGKVLRHTKAMGFIFCISFALGGLFTFLTSSPFAYMEYFRISPNIYPLLFGSNVLLYMMLNRFNMKLLNRYEPIQLIPFGVALQVFASLCLVVYVTFYQPQFEVVYLLILMNISSISLIAANATSCTLTYFPDLAGTANAVIGTMNFGLAGLTGIITSLFHDGSLMPMAVTMLVGSSLSLLAFVAGRQVAEPEVNYEQVHHRL